MEKTNRFKIFASIMIAIVTIFGATAACLASFASTGAGNADFDGLAASIKAQEAQILNQVTAYEHYRAYTTYRRYLELGHLLHDQTTVTDPDEITLINREKREVWGMALGLQHTFFPPRYLDPDGAYNTQRELDEEWADAAQKDDLLSAPHFDKAEALRIKSNMLAADMIVFAGAFWCFTLAEVIENRWKYLFAAGGIILTLAGLAGIILVEMSA